MSGGGESYHATIEATFKSPTFGESRNGTLRDFGVKTKDSKGTPPGSFTAKAPENESLEDEFPFGKAYFQGRTVKLWGGISKQDSNYLNSC